MSLVRKAQFANQIGYWPLLIIFTMEDGMRRLIYLSSLMVIILVIIAGTVAMAEEGQGKNFLPILMIEEECWPTDVPAGALPEQPPPVFCLIDNYGPNTAQSGDNTWSDDFNHGLSFANFANTQYRTFDNLGAWKTIFWRHADHWMIDLAPQSQDGGGVQGHAILSPNQTFNFINNKLVVETTISAGMEAYFVPYGGAWSDIVVSTADAPAELLVGRYGYDLFPEGWTLGCRIQPNRLPSCALKADDGSPTDASTQIWEMSYSSLVGTESFGGFPADGLEDYWRVCAIDEPDINCRDHFRLELTETSLKLFVNEHLYFAQTGIPPLPDGLLEGDVYVYLVSSHVRHNADTIRYHWDNFHVNPDAQGNNWKEPSIYGTSPLDSMLACLLPN